MTRNSDLLLLLLLLLLLSHDYLQGGVRKGWETCLVDATGHSAVGTLVYSVGMVPTLTCCCWYHVSVYKVE